MRNLRTEDEIIANWKGGTEPPVVSICCITYNHESFIEDALEGFLKQVTDFSFEILIHDDASTDETADIIRKYEAKYPKLIKPIYQVVNQYSKIPSIAPRFLFPIARGEYIAMCEGDDYWVAPEKLQSQIGLMRQYPDIKISFHPAYKVEGHVLKKDKIYADYGSSVKVFELKSVVLGSGQFMPTSSLMINRRVIKSRKLNCWLEASPVGDFIIQVYCSLDKGALFIPCKFSTYRFGSVGSWTASMSDLKIRQNFLTKRVESFKVLANDLPELRIILKWLIFKSNINFLLLSIKNFSFSGFINAVGLIFKGAVF